MIGTSVIFDLAHIVDATRAETKSKGARSISYLVIFDIARREHGESNLLFSISIDLFMKIK